MTSILTRICLYVLLANAYILICGCEVQTILFIPLRELETHPYRIAINYYPGPHRLPFRSLGFARVFPVPLFATPRLDVIFGLPSLATRFNDVCPVVRQPDCLDGTQDRMDKTR